MNMSYFNLPDKYKIFFYALGIKNETGAPRTIDLLGWTYIPPPNFKLTLIPEKIDQISFKETKTIQVIAESNIDLPAKVKIGAKEGYKSDSNLFNFNVENNKETDIIPYGKYKTNLDIQYLTDLTSSTFIIIEANFSLSNQTYSPHFKTQQGDDYYPTYIIPSSVTTQSIELPIVMTKSLSEYERFINFINEMNRIITPLHTLITGIFGIGGIIFGAVFSDKIKKILYPKNDLNKIKIGLGKSRLRKSRFKKDTNTKNSE